MSHARTTRMTTALVVAAQLAGVPASLTAGERATLRGERRHTQTQPGAAASPLGGEGFLATAWHWLVDVWAAQGGLIDPNGSPMTPPPPPTSPTSTSTIDQGGLIDPNGTRSTLDGTPILPLP